jgi:hypothetical protein
VELVGNVSPVVRGDVLEVGGIDVRGAGEDGLNLVCRQRFAADGEGLGWGSGLGWLPGWGLLGVLTFLGVLEGLRAFWILGALC